MCGLIGFVHDADHQVGWNDKNQKLRAFINQGLMIDTLRGQDATGLARVHRARLNEPAEVFKKAVSGPDFIQLSKAQELMSNPSDTSILIGHNRSATRGNNTNNSAHPFQVDHITLVHNGTLTNYHRLSKRNPAEVDSAYIAGALADREPKDVLPELDGSYTLVWHDARDGSINFARNKDRPLWWIALGTEKEHWPGILFGSEMGMLWWLAERNGIPTQGKFKTIAVHQHIKLSPKDMSNPVVVPYSPEERKYDSFRRGAGDRGTTTPSQTSTPLLPSPGTGANGSSSGTAESNKGELLSGRKGKAQAKLRALGLDYGSRIIGDPTEYVAHGKSTKYGFARFEHRPRGLVVEIAQFPKEKWDLIKNQRCLLRAVNVRNGQKGTKIVMAEFEREMASVSHINARGVMKLVRGPQGYYIPLAEFNRLTEQGCSHCEAPVSSDFADHMLWAGVKKEPVCHECASNPGVRALLGVDTGGSLQ